MNEAFAKTIQTSSQEVIAEQHARVIRNSKDLPTSDVLVAILLVVLIFKWMFYRFASAIGERLSSHSSLLSTYVNRIANLEDKRDGPFPNYKVKESLS